MLIIVRNMSLEIQKIYVVKYMVRNRKGVIIKKQNLYNPLDNINIEKQLIVRHE
jgi:hypothetical protein